jgi:hypothetical protein
MKKRKKEEKKEKKEKKERKEMIEKKEKKEKKKKKEQKEKKKRDRRADGRSDGQRDRQMNALKISRFRETLLRTNKREQISGLEVQDKNFMPPVPVPKMRTGKLRSFL